MVMKNMLSRLILIFVFYAATASSHDRKNVDDFNVVFDGEPEPMVNDERQALSWRFTNADTNELVTDLEALEAVVTFEGKVAGTFTARGSRRDPGIYKTTHIFTSPGE